VFRAPSAASLEGRSHALQVFNKEEAKTVPDPPGSEEAHLEFFGNVIPNRGGEAARRAI
jgi:hypothetical protein